MSDFLLKDEMEITDKLLFYIEDEAKSLSEGDSTAINNFIDRELFNPSMEKYLQTQDAIQDLNDEPEQMDPLQLNFIQSIKEKSILPEWLRFRFRRLKRKVKRIFCQVVRGIEDDLDWKGIIKLVLLALIPAFASGIPGAVLPIIIGLLAYLIKYGLDKTCPI